jgi:hypothetical protein
MAKTITLGLRIRGHRRQVGKPFQVTSQQSVDFESICSIVDGHYY